MFPSPLIIHQYWHNETAPLPIWREYMRFSYDSVLWTPETVPAKLATLLSLINGTVRPEDQHRHEANLVRYWVLYEYGGIWLDVDVLPIDDLRSHNFPYVAAHGKTACTCVMAFNRGDEILLKAIDRIIGLPYDPEAHCVDVSGDALLNDVIDDSVSRRQLPFDAVGYPIKDGSLWAIHLYNTTGERCR